jgi:hypothetical protein
MLLVLFFLMIGSAAAVYAVVGHGTDWQVAFGIAALAVVIALFVTSGQIASEYDAGPLLDVFLSPAKLGDAYGRAIGYGPTLLALGVGAVAGLGLSGLRHAAAERRTQSQTATQAPDPSRGPVTEPHADSPQPTTPAADSAIFRLLQEPPVAPKAPATPTAPAVPIAPASQPSTQVSTASTNRLTTCPACFQLLRIGEIRGGTCPNCSARIDI